MQKIKPLFVCSFIILCSAFITKDKSAKIEWLKLDEVSAKIKEQSKPVLIDLYTDWCHWCKVMDKKTYGNSKVIQYINEHFYSARINAESREPFNWKNKTYAFNARYQVSDFALYVTYGRMSFPTTVIIADEESAPIPIAGFMEPKELEGILKYYGEGAYKTKNYREFEKTFKSTW